MTLGAQPECNQKPGARRDGTTAFESVRNGVFLTKNFCGTV